jgi:oxalate decarboxylase/phosphoglucose isomerase-like protein (cupin superfamily)
MNGPYLLRFQQIGGPAIGHISVLEQAQEVVPFAVKRVFWTYGTPETIVRGRHAHHATEQVLVAIAGRIVVTTEGADGAIRTFRLDDPNTGLYVPPNVWHTMHYSAAAVQLVFASTPYNEQDYIRDYDQFRQIWAGQV